MNEIVTCHPVRVLWCKCCLFPHDHRSTISEPDYATNCDSTYTETLTYNGIASSTSLIIFHDCGHKATTSPTPFIPFSHASSKSFLEHCSNSSKCAIDRWCTAAATTVSKELTGSSTEAVPFCLPLPASLQSNWVWDPGEEDSCHESCSRGEW